MAPKAAVRVVPAALAATGAGLSFEAGGYFPRAWIWSAVVLLWLAALGALFHPRLLADRRAAVFAVSLALLTAWTLLSAAWSPEPAQSLLEARRGAVYLGIVAAVLCTCGRLAARQIPGALLAAATLVAGVGVGRYLASGPLDPFQGSLLSWPVGYANAFAAITALSLPLGLGLATHGRTAWGRAAAAAALSPLLSVLLVTSSNGGELAAVAGVVALVALDERRSALLRVALRLAVPATALVAVGTWADLPNRVLESSALDRTGRAALAAAVVGCAALGALLAWRRAPPVRRRSLPRLAALGAALAAGLVGAVTSALPELGHDGLLRRLVGVERAGYWKVAWHVVVAHPWLGSGAGTFGRAWSALGPRALEGALDAHGLYLETLAELGPVGLLLLLVALSVPLASSRAAARASRLGAAAAAGYVAFLVHAFIDWDWEMPSVTVPGLALGAAVVLLARSPAAARPLGGRLRAGLAAAAVALALAALLGLRSTTEPAATAASGAAVARRAWFRGGRC